VQEWQPPNEFDLVKELNAHAGRLGTIIGLMFTAAVLIVTNSPMRETLRLGQPENSTGTTWTLLVLGILGAVAVSIMNGMLEVMLIQQPPFPLRWRDREHWAASVAYKHNRCIVGTGYIAFTIPALIVVWGLAYLAATSAPQWVGIALAIALGVMALQITRICFRLTGATAGRLGDVHLRLRRGVLQAHDNIQAPQSATLGSVTPIEVDGTDR
jgi:hypothetical protein